jgi:hypothetical protein
MKFKSKQNSKFWKIVSFSVYFNWIYVNFTNDLGKSKNEKRKKKKEKEK